MKFSFHFVLFWRWDYTEHGTWLSSPSTAQELCTASLFAFVLRSSQYQSTTSTTYS